jgi:hypothetical protein
MCSLMLSRSVGKLATVRAFCLQRRACFSALQVSSTASTCECVKRVRFHVRWETTSPHCTTDEPPSATTKAAKNVFDAAAAMASAASLADWTA